MSRLDASINNLTTLQVNTDAAKSRIEDADFAAETSNLTKAQILSQAATSMLAQANAPKQAVNTLVGNVMQSQWDPTFFLVQGGGYRYKNI